MNQRIEAKRDAILAKIAELFSDTSVSASETRIALESIRDQLDIQIESLECSDD